MNRRTSPTLAVLLLVLQMVAGAQASAADMAPATPSSAAPEATRPGAVQVAPGITYRRVVNTKIPRVAHILTVDPAVASLDVALARPELPGFALTSAMARDNGAIAAVNGDFGISPGRPVHLYADDGELVQTSISGGHGRGFGIPGDGGSFRFGTTRPRISLVDGSMTGEINQWNNGEPGPGEIVAFTNKGGSIEVPPSESCSARLLPLDASWAPSGTGMQRTLTVDAIKCGSGSMNLGGGIVVSSRTSGPGAATLQALHSGDTVTVSWTLGWKGVTDVLGGSFLLVKDGQIAVEPSCTSYLCLRHPRTGVGITVDGKVLIMVVEGRYYRSKGATPAQFAHLFMAQGAVDALNLDGGGSSDMVINGKVVNHLADGYERPVSSSLLVFP